MTRFFSSKLALLFAGLLIILCSCTRNSRSGGTTDTTGKPIIDVAKQSPAEKSGPANQAQVQEKIEDTAAVETYTMPSNVVAKIGDYTITRKEVEKRLMEKLSPDEYRWASDQSEHIDAKTVLLEMIAEKAMIIEARKQNFTEREAIQEPIEQSKERKLFSMILRKCVQGNIDVTESEIDEKIKADPKLSRNKAKTMLKGAKANKLIDDYYNGLYKKFNVQKARENFPKAIEIHQRLLLNPEKSRRRGFIRASQVKEELTQQERDIVLAKHDNGRVTLKNWLEVLFETAPPSRPRDLHTPQGFERQLDKALKKAIFIAEAKSLGLDKDQNLLNQLKAEQDRRLLREIINEQIKDINGPSDEQEIIAYYNKNKEVFGIEPQLKINQIWCQDLKTAQKAKVELDKGKDFESVRKDFSLLKKSRILSTSPGQEGMFFDELRKGEPNEIVGPVKGYYRNRFKWRVVKILDKKPVQLREYSSEMKEYIKRRITRKQKNDVLAKFREELLGKYPYDIYNDKIKDLNPLNIP